MDKKQNQTSERMWFWIGQKTKEDVRQYAIRNEHVRPSGKVNISEGIRRLVLLGLEVDREAQ